MVRSKPGASAGVILRGRCRCRQVSSSVGQGSAGSAAFGVEPLLAGSVPARTIVIWRQLFAVAGHVVSAQGAEI